MTTIVKGDFNSPYQVKGVTWSCSQQIFDRRQTCFQNIGWNRWMNYWYLDQIGKSEQTSKRRNCAFTFSIMLSIQSLDCLIMRPRIEDIALIS
jgi:hypothetical protein